MEEEEEEGSIWRGVGTTYLLQLLVGDGHEDQILLRNNHLGWRLAMWGGKDGGVAVVLFAAWRDAVLIALELKLSNDASQPRTAQADPGANVGCSPM